MEDPRVEALKSSINKFLHERILTGSELIEIWDTIGYDVQYRKTYIDRFTQNVIKMFNHGVLSELNKKKALLEEIDILGVEFLSLKDDLKSNLADPDDNFSILEIKDYLERNKAILMREKDERISQYETLKRREEQATKKLGIPAKLLSFSLAPKPDELDDYKVYIISLEDELAKRKRILDGARPHIVSLMTQLEYTIHSDFQKEVVFEDNFFFSDGNMREIELLKSDLSQQLEKSKADAKDLRAKVVSLWNFLQINQEEQEGFLEKCTGHSRSDMEILNKEIDRCYQLKLANIEKYVKNIRVEITNYWKKMFMEDMEKCSYFQNEIFTENLLVIHEHELECLKKRYQEANEIYAALHDRLKLWERKKSLENNDFDPYRFNNRGGKLLLDQKERAKIDTRLPKIDEKILSMVGIWQQKKGEKFLVCGQSIEEFFQTQRDIWEREKENIKSEIKTQNENKTALGSTKRPREGAGTPVRGGSKIARTNQTPLLTPLTSHYNNTRAQMSSCAKPPLSSSRKIAKPSHEKGGRFQPARLFCKKSKPPAVSRQMIGTEDNPFSTSIESTNSEFKKNLNVKSREDKYCRSSAIASTPPTTPQRPRDRFGLPFLYNS